MRAGPTTPKPTNRKIARTDHRAGPAGFAAAIEFERNAGIRAALAELGEAQSILQSSIRSLSLSPNPHSQKPEPLE